MTRGRAAKKACGEADGQSTSSRRPSGVHNPPPCGSGSGTLESVLGPDPERRCGNSDLALTCFYALAYAFGLGLLCVVLTWIICYP